MVEFSFFRKNAAKSLAVILSLASIMALASCGSESVGKPENTAKPAITDNIPETTDETTDDTPLPTASAKADSGVIKKISGGADDVGIYSVVVRLTDEAADKGVLELVYHGAKGTPQENSVVNTFRIEYEKGTDGLFEIHTFFNGEVYQNYHKKEEVNVTNTFDALLRAGDVTISYTPDGGETKEIFKATADYFR